MAMFHIGINPIKRSAGQHATAAAAYRAGECIRDERTGDVHNHSRRQDVTHTEIFLPSKFGDVPMEWARNRATLWNTAEAAERRRDARVAREFQVTLPYELSSTQRLALARGFARELSDRYGLAVDLAIHDPKAGGDPRNFHAHLLTTTREVTATGLGAKAGLDMQVVQRARQGMSDHSEEYVAVRERWANHVNEALREANIEARVDHRGFAALGIERRPMVHVPMEFYQRQIKGMKPGELARLREDYRARLAARLDHSKQRAPTEKAAPPVEKTVDRGNVEEIRRNAVESWLRMRSKEAESSLEKRAASEDSQPRSGEQPALGDRSTEGSPPRDADRRQPAERDHDRNSESAAPPERDDDASM